MKKKFFGRHFQIPTNSYMYLSDAPLDFVYCPTKSYKVLQSPTKSYKVLQSPTVLSPTDALGGDVVAQHMFHHHIFLYKNQNCRTKVCLGVCQPGRSNGTSFNNV